MWIIEESARRKREKVVRRKKKKKRLRKIFGEKKFVRQKLKRTSGYSKSFLKYVYLKNSRERFGMKKNCDERSGQDGKR